MIKWRVNRLKNSSLFSQRFKKKSENSHGNFPLARTKELLLAASLTRKIKMRNVIFFTREGHRSFAVFNCNRKFSSRQESEVSERDETS